MLVIQLVGIDEIKFDTGENFCPRQLTLQSFGPFFQKTFFHPWFPQLLQSFGLKYTGLKRRYALFPL